MIEARALTKEAHGKRLLDGVSFKLLNGKVYGILGDADEANCLLALLAGADAPSEGAVRINGFDTVADEKKAKRCTAALLEPSMLCEELTVHEFLLFVAQARGIDYEKGVRQAREAEELCSLYEKRERMIRNLSAQERVRLCLAQAAIGGGEILLLAQPLSVLNEAAQEELLPLLEELFEGKTVFISDTDRERLCRLCDTLLILEDSKLTAVEELSPKEQRDAPENTCEEGGATE